MGKLLIDADQREYLFKQGFLPLSDLLRPQELKDLNEAIDAYDITKKFADCDLWRKEEKIKRFVAGKRLGDFAAELLRKKVIRLAYDLVVESSSISFPKIGAGGRFQEYSSIKGLELLFIFCLKKEEDSLYPLQIGEACVVLAGAPFPPACLLPAKSTRVFVVAFGGQHCQYLHEPKDPLQHYLKQLGYAWGDKLRDEFHPIIVR